MAKPMSPTRFHAALDALELKTYDQAAAVTGVGRRSLVRYGTGALPVPKVLELLLEEWLEHGVPKRRHALWTPKGGWQEAPE